VKKACFWRWGSKKAHADKNIQKMFPKESRETSFIRLEERVGQGSEK
jgi:hypothetical protein